MKQTDMPDYTAHIIKYNGEAECCDIQWHRNTTGYYATNVRQQ